MSLVIDYERVEFIGIEIIFIGEDDSRGSVWIEFNETLSLLYGKNGAGKSTILNAISAFMEGTSLEDEGILVHGYARLINPDKSCSIIDQAVKSMPSTDFLTVLEDLKTADVSNSFASMAGQINLPHTTWEASLFGATPDSEEDLMMNWNKFVSHFIFLGLWERDLVHDLDVIKPFALHLIQERIISLRPTGQDQAPSWKVGLAAKVDHPEVREAYEHLLENPEYEFYDWGHEHQITQVLVDRNILSSRSDMPRTSSPYISAAGIYGQSISFIDMSFVNLNEEVNIEEWTKRRISELVHSGWASIDDPWFSIYPNDPSPTSSFAVEKKEQDPVDAREESNADGDSIVWSANFGSRRRGSRRKIEFEFLGERFTMLQNALTFIAKQLPEELAISDLRIELERDLGLWIFNQPGTLQAYDLRSQNWIPVNSTSNATQSIIGMALRIHSDIRSSGNNAIAVGDEIDRGLHTMAVNGLYKMLADSVTTSFIASHSPVALSTKLGQRLHVHRGVSGEVLTSPISNRDFLSTTSSNLGVRVNELIGMIDLVVAVEGLHDKVVLEYFIKLDERLSNSNILVISLAGVNNATNLLDADFLLLYTDLRILVLADNTSKTELELTRIDTIEKLSSGEAASNIAQSLRGRAEELKKQKWHEQYCMMEFLAVAAERNLITRIRTSGHIYADIETALDPEFFGLDKDWLELEAEYRKFKSDTGAKRKNFKDFLRSAYKVSITSKTIIAALSRTEEVPPGIKLVLDDIVTNAYQTDLLKNWS